MVESDKDRSTEPTVTIAIPTYNRAGLLRSSLTSVLDQDHPSFRVMVLDNASSDDTETVVRSFADSRIHYVRNDSNIGLFCNWNRALELNTSPYLTILQDDDELLPGFLSASAQALDAHPAAGFSVTGAKGIDINDVPTPLRADAFPSGFVTSEEFLHGIVAGRNWVIHPSAVMIRASCLGRVGGFDTVHSSGSIDFNLYLRLAARHGVAFVPGVLCRVRVHPGQAWTDHLDTWPLSNMAERNDAIAHLLGSARADDVAYRRWLAERLLFLSMVRSDLTSQLLPDLNLSWSERVEIASQEIVSLISPGQSFVLLDEASLPTENFADRNVIPFLEREGYPADDETAIRHLEALRARGESRVVIAWPAFWWLDYYSRFREYLHSRFQLVRSNSRVMVFC